MAAYNRLNGKYVAEHPWLLTTVLRDEWAWDGVVVSDWYATQSTAEALKAGLDLEMPGPSQLRGDKLLKALETGELSRGNHRSFGPQGAPPAAPHSARRSDGGLRRCPADPPAKPVRAASSCCTTTGCCR